MAEEQNKPKSDDLDEQEAELLPDREAMSLLQPYPGLDDPLAVVPDATDTPGSAESV